MNEIHMDFNIRLYIGSFRSPTPFYSPFTTWIFNILLLPFQSRARYQKFSLLLNQLSSASSALDRSTQRAANVPKTATTKAPYANPTLWTTRLPPPNEDPELVAAPEAEVEVEVDDPVPVASPTLIPKVVPVIVAPTVFVVVNVTVAVVVAAHAVQLVHGALLSQVPLVQPVHEVSGQPFPPHHAVHGPEVQEPVVPQGPHPPPKGPPLDQPEPVTPGQGPPLVQDVAVPVKVASGAAVTGEPAAEQREAIFWYTADQLCQ